MNNKHVIGPQCPKTPAGAHSARARAAANPATALATTVLTALLAWPATASAQSQAASVAAIPPLPTQAAPQATQATARPAAQAASQPARSSRATATNAEAGKPAKPQNGTPVCEGEIAASVPLSLPENKSTQLDLARLDLPSPAWLRTIGDPEVVQVEPMVSAAPRSMFFLFGKRVGSTNLMFQDRQGRCAMVEISVGIDTAAVQSKIRQLMPNEPNVRIESAADSLVISGTVSDAFAADRIISIAQAFLRRSAAPMAGGMAPPMPGAAAPAGGVGSDRIVNMMSLAAPQQVMLEVKVAEISKSLLDKLGVGATVNGSSGSWMGSLASNFLTGGNGLLSFIKSNGTRLQIDAEKRDGLVKVLAEPNIMAISGQEGSFLAGGKILIPVAQSGVGVGTAITLEEKEFGVGLRFTPTVLDNGRINLKVAPEVSELSREGVGIQTAGLATGNAVLPLMTTRRASTTVQLYDGQSFAIGGLIKSNAVQNIRAFPVLGEVPVLGALFRSSDFATDLTELVFIVTPRLAKPLPPEFGLPTDAYVPPTRPEFFLGGKMEGSTPPPPPALPPQTRAPADPDFIEALP